MNKNVDISRSAHVVVVGNEKGGTGKSTICMHVLTALLQAGQRVASIDLDGRQGTLTYFVENRKIWSRQRSLDLEIPRHFVVHRHKSLSVSDCEEAEFAAFAEAVNEVEREVDFLVIDTPAADTYLMRLAHSMADTLITPFNDSHIDFDVLAKVDPENYDIIQVNHYAMLVREARRQRRSVEHDEIDWVVVRNGLSPFASRSRTIEDGLHQLALRLGFRVADSIRERNIFKEFYLKGLTALDRMDEQTLGAEPTLSHLSARQEVRALMAALRLPLNRLRHNGVALRKTWHETRSAPMEMHDILDL